MIDGFDDDFEVDDEYRYSLEYLKYMFRACEQERIEMLSLDPEWTTKHFIHMSDIISGFSIGIIRSDPYYLNYRLPPNYEKVMNFMIEKLQEEFDNQEVIEVGLLKIRGVYKRLALQCPEYCEWNKFQGKREYIYENMYELVERDFIDLEVPPHNAALYLRNMIREEKKFKENFEGFKGIDDE